MLYVSGALGGGYTREVGRPPAEVMAALADLDITAQPGSPATDPSRSGGVQPVFLLERTSDRMIWTVMSGDQVAIRLHAMEAELRRNGCPTGRPGGFEEVSDTMSRGPVADIQVEGVSFKPGEPMVDPSARKGRN